MTTNVGNIDRAVRALLGIVLIAIPFVSGLALFESTLASAISVIVGLVMLVVATTRVCPIYSILGIKSCKA
ncbi:YgaP family membrane protein [Litoreibacter arenae]|uniref:Inner membrane protein YgaP-like transmembrane domain-containing protein n=1 Tax=Litoreibacter arenae DSM 19593 TaxID=1123360 RepID=S9QAL3_9RHOB|nr:DUF2892 domain-containing protein [Litoreibacter arenae]EPX77017.1 hypothetical protein thalar_02736 [Litoreibacter arenae DSM 19593]